MYKKVIIVFLIVVAIILTGCNFDREKSEKLTVAVTIMPQQEFVRAVCGDKVDVVVLVPPGSSPETYEPTSKEIAAFHKSSIYFAIGMPIEGINILPVAENMKVVKLHEEAAKVYEELYFEGEERDHHVWLSPKRVKVMVEAIAREMSEIDPENAEIYMTNSEKYLKELEEVDEKIKETLKDLTNRKIMVFHPAFGYFASDYELEMYSLEEEGKEATAKRLEELIDLARRENIKAIFYQSEVDASQSKAFAEEIGGKAIMLEPLAKDYIKNLEKMARLIAEADNG
ncbi:MAG TPA: zinc ABC transporter solute-binding protein [Clostridiaceae bacterium]|jgi:zinc transport system substrate-binding protein|nr:zinc ABC transporter solute-binding protein [Clostridiaceae bacterium]